MKPTALENAQVTLTEAARRPSAIEKHIAFKQSIATPSRKFDELDELDELLDELAVVDPYEVHAPSRRSDKSLASLLDLLDNLENGKGTR